MALIRPIPVSGSTVTKLSSVAWTVKTPATTDSQPVVYKADLSSVSGYSSLTIDDIIVEWTQIACRGGAPNAALTYAYDNTTGELTCSNKIMYGIAGMTQTSDIYIVR